MKHKNLTLFIIILINTIKSAYSSDLSSIANQLKLNYKHSLAHTRNQTLTIANLKLFQFDLVKKRNAECLYKYHRNFDFSSHIKFTNASLINRTRWIQDSSGLNHSFIVESLNNTCLETSSLLDLFKASSNEEYEGVFDIISTQIFNEGCNMCPNETNNKVPITKYETWGYGILFVTLISLSSLCGAFVIPFSNKRFYKKILMILIGVAVGSLAGSGFLHLIPQAFGITDDSRYNENHDYVWKGVVMMGGVYLFYLVEKILKIMILRRKMMKKNASNHYFKTQKNHNSEIYESMGYLKTHDRNLEPNVEMRLSIDQIALKQFEQEHKSHGHSHEIYSVAPVAWMIIFGDGLHNFIDGLSIGAAFTDSILKGVSICLAVICEEFPHELGDFAILINAGMSYPVALLFNFLSACCCYVGLVVGITLGENFGANKWIYAIAGGMFLYISLCDMIPELNEMGEQIEKDYFNDKKSKKQNDTADQVEEEKNLAQNVDVRVEEPFEIAIKLKILFLQNIGILFGFCFMLFMAIYSERIQF